MSNRIEKALVGTEDALVRFRDAMTRTNAQEINEAAELAWRWAKEIKDSISDVLVLYPNDWASRDRVYETSLTLLMEIHRLFGGPPRDRVKSLPLPVSGVLAEKFEQCGGHINTVMHCVRGVRETDVGMR